MTGEHERLPRLLALIPYLQARDGITVAEAAADFAITEAQLRRDLQLLWMCGLPGHGPGDLIDLSFAGDTISVSFDAGMRRPLRLTAAEALPLVVALRVLAELPADPAHGLADRDAVERALAKVEAATAGPVDAAAMSVALDASERLLPVLRQGVDAGRALRLRYYTATRDDTTERVVDPMRVFELAGHTYLEAWCRRAEGMRVFRADRIDEAALLDEPADPPPQARLRDLAGGVYAPAPEHLLVVLRIAPAYFWVADYYPIETDDAETDGGGGASERAETSGHRRISLRVADPAWVRALALGSAGAVAVLAPQWLAESIRAEADAALARYDDPPAG